MNTYQRQIIDELKEGESYAKKQVEWYEKNIVDKGMANVFRNELSEYIRAIAILTEAYKED